MTKPQRVIVIYAKKDDEYNNNPNHFIIHRRSCSCIKILFNYCKGAFPKS